MTPVEGQENTYDLVRADEPIEVGTPLNKASLLSDDTVAALKLQQSNPTVNDALLSLCGKAEIEHGSYIGTGTYGENGKTEINFSNQANMVVICPDYLHRELPVVIKGQTELWTGNSSDYACSVEWGDTYLRIWSKDRYVEANIRATAQLNSNGQIYYYVAI